MKKMHRWSELQRPLSRCWSFSACIH